VRDQNELKESEARARAFRQISVSYVLLEMSKEVQMLYTHSSVTHSPVLLVKTKGPRCIAESSSYESFSCGQRRYTFCMHRRMQHVLPIGCPSVVDNNLLADSTGGTNQPALLMRHGKFV